MTELMSGLSSVVDDEEQLTRFLVQSNQFNTIMVKPAAFLPNPKDRETSVFRHCGEPKEELWEIGMAVAAQRNLYGAAIVKARVAREARLDVMAAEPPHRHAVLKGWPWYEDTPEDQKAMQIEIAQILASKSELINR